MIHSPSLGNQIIVHPIHDLEARMQAEYIYEDNFNKTTEWSSQDDRKTTAQKNFIDNSFCSRIYNEQETLTIANRIRRWIVEKKFHRPLASNYHWWVTNNYDEEFTPDGDICANFYVKSSPTTGQFLIWSNKVTPKQDHVYLFPGKIKYAHSPNYSNEDRMIISYSFYWGGDPQFNV